MGKPDAAGLSWRCGTWTWSGGCRTLSRPWRPHWRSGTGAENEVQRVIDILDVKIFDLNDLRQSLAKLIDK
ncbi:hypothetical protein SKAU_G00205530 [Synaphobranchus kaupii]|uniref:Uncharacterized protein n=1 Tax=Synaphobranchus kaupii TaxID=118154 RepID=A0A9Q1IXQ7_SYNKA|nr:hypothetical protein SKAU_G00205530 [Synaphobranchus kaupii]